MYPRVTVNRWALASDLSYVSLPRRVPEDVRKTTRPPTPTPTRDETGETKQRRKGDERRQAGGTKRDTHGVTTRFKVLGTRRRNGGWKKGASVS